MTATARIAPPPLSDDDGFCVRSLAATYPHGSGEPPHRHAWGQLVYGVSGVIRVALDRAAWIAPPTRAIWVPPGVTHALSMKGQVAMRTLYIAPGWAAPLPAEAAVLEVEPLLREVVLHVLRLGMLAPEQPEQARLAGFLIDRLAAARPQDLGLPLPADRRARALCERIQASPDDRRGLPALAREAGASLRTLQRVFPAETGLSLDGWRQKARLIHGMAILSAGTSVTSAALDCGYDSVSAFIAAFRRQFGVTPGRVG
ncbi:AraC family transcriptional regulator [Caulobacter sp. KR2-114]|uniref:AraC family transcriptional regulator n=1 Tax=Caulobacter sp. KR2-114 TaxID=3400912 RepID=UPI003C086458